VLTLSPFVRGCCSVLIDVGVDWGFLEGRRRRVDYGNVDVEGVGTFDVLNVRADMFRIVPRGSNLADFELHAEVGLLDTGVESLDELVEPIADIIVTKVAGPLVEGTAETVERVNGSVEGLVASADAK
jgi:hypothetical protein